MTKQTVLTSLALASAVALGSTAAWAAGPPIGSAFKVVNSVTADTRPLATGGDVSQDETIEVAAQSLGELKLNDDSKIALGENSRLKLDKFVYDPNKTGNTIAVDLVRGAFRFITGLASKPTYLIRTPAAALTVRGTVFDVYIDAANTVWILIHEGSIVISAGGQTRVLDNPCTIIRITAAGDISTPAAWGTAPGTSTLDFATAFPFVVTPPSVDPRQLHTQAEVTSNTCADTRGRRTQVDPGQTVPPQTPPTRTPPTPPPYEPAYPTPVGPTPVAPIAPVQNMWTGPYGGVSIGYGGSGEDTSLGCYDPNGLINCPAGYALGIIKPSYSLDPNGVLGGVTAGYNMQTGGLVYGLEIDFSATDIDGEINENIAGLYITQLEQDLQWLSTLRARVGFVTGDWLFYATGGLAVGQSKLSFLTFNLPGGADVDGSVSDTRVDVGWAAGAGAEYSFGNWSLRGEYLYFDLGNETLTAPATVGGAPSGGSFSPEFDMSGHIGRIGINFKLD